MPADGKLPLDESEKEQEKTEISSANILLRCRIRIRCCNWRMTSNFSKSPFAATVRNGRKGPKGNKYGVHSAEECYFVAYQIRAKEVLE